MFRGRTLSTITAILLSAALASLGACNDQRPTEPPAPTASAALDLWPSEPRLVECKTDETTTSGPIVVDPLGGTVALGGTSVFFPAGAFLVPTSVTLTIPASRYLEVHIETSGASYFPDNARPVVTIDYSRCTRSDILTKPLSVWYIDSETKKLLEQMPVSADDKLLRRITFSTGHFSGYAIAF